MLKNSQKQDGWLVALYVFLVLTSVVIIQVSSKKFLMVDSRVYLETAENLSTGRGFVFGSNGQQVFCSVWPMGYPLLIVLVQKLTQLSFFWASKVVNYVGLAALFGLFRRLAGGKAWFVALVMLNGIYIKQFSYTMSEPTFLVLLLYFIFVLYQLILHPAHRANYLWLCLLMCSLFITRYIGSFTFVVVGTIAVYHFFKKHYQLAFRLLATVLLATLFAMTYLAYNYQQSGFFAGDVQRFGGIALSTQQIVFQFARAFFNEFLLIKDYDIGDNAPFDLLAMIGLIVQLFWLYWITKHWKSTGFGWRFDFFCKLTFGVATGYFIVFALIWLTNPLESIYYRYLSPFTLPVLVALLYSLTLPAQEVVFASIKKSVVILMICTLCNLLPGIHWEQRTPELLEKVMGYW
ncbi:MAG: hypothetical protein U0Y10_11925 [Spirosomataceae bacterium]